MTITDVNKLVSGAITDVNELVSGAGTLEEVFVAWQQWSNMTTELANRLNLTDLVLEWLSLQDEGPGEYAKGTVEDAWLVFHDQVPSGKVQIGAIWKSDYDDYGPVYYLETIIPIAFLTSSVYREVEAGRIKEAAEAAARRVKRQQVLDNLVRAKATLARQQLVYYAAVEAVKTAHAAVLEEKEEEPNVG